MKILSRQKIRNLVRRLKARGKKIVFTNGCFDLLHAGHVRYLEKARALGDILVVAINTDSSVRKLKGPGRPIINQADRAEIVAGLAAVDYVVLFGERTPQRIIRELKPDVLVKGADYRKEKVVGGAEVKRAGGKVVLVPLVRNRSTSLLIKKIKEEL